MKEINMKDYLIDTTGKIKSLNDRFKKLKDLTVKYNIKYETMKESDRDIADDLILEVYILIDYLKKFAKLNKGGG